MLQARFAIVRGLARLWDNKSLRNIMTACVILDNMIIDDERDLNLEFFYDNVGSHVKPTRDGNEIMHFLTPTGRLRTMLHTTSFVIILLSISGNSMGDRLPF